MPYIPNKLLFFRIKMKLTQQDVTTHLGLASTDRVSEWERWISYPSVPNLLKLVKLYEVKVEEVYK